MHIIPTSPPFLASATGNTIKDKAVINTSVGKATNDNSIKEGLIKPTTKSMKKKLKAREMKAKKERAPVAAKAVKAKATFKTTPFVIATDGTATKSTAPVGSATTVKDNILVASDASKFVHTSDTVTYITTPTSHLLEVTDELLPASTGSVPTLSDPGEDFESALESALESAPGSEDEGYKDKNNSSFSDAGLNWRAKKILRDLEEKRLGQATGGGSSLRHKNPVKKGRVPLDKTAKKDHQSTNPLARTILKNRNKKEACRMTWDKLQAANGVSLPRLTPSTLHSSTTSSATPSVENFSDSVEYFNDLKFDDENSLFVNENDLDDDADSGAKNVPDLPTSVPISATDICLTTTNLVVDDISYYSQIFEDIGVHLYDTDDNDASSSLDAGDFPAGIFDANNTTEIAHEARFVEEFKLEKRGDEQSGLSHKPKPLIKLDDAATRISEDNTMMERSNGGLAVKTHVTADIIKEVMSPAQETINEPVNQQPFSLDNQFVEDIDLPSKQLINDAIASSVLAETTEYHDEITPICSLVDESRLSLLMLPNTAQYISALSRDEELALIATHITPLCPSIVPKRDVANNSAEKDQTAEGLARPSVAEEALVSSAELLTKRDTAAMAKPTDSAPQRLTEDISITDHEIAVAVEVSTINKACIVTQEDAPIVLEAIIDSYVASFLRTPNGAGQDAAMSQLMHDLVTLHIVPLAESEPCEQNELSTKPLKPKKTSIPAADSTLLQNEGATVIISPVFETLSVQDFVVTELFQETHRISGQDTGTEQELKTLDEFSISNSSDKDAIRRSSMEWRGRIATSTPKCFKPSSVHSSIGSNGVDLDCKLHMARNTFLGITSLEEFLEELEFEASDGTTTKQDICEAFATLSGIEFEVLQGYRPDTAFFDFESSLARRKVKMGTLSMETFLRAISFDDEDIAPLKDVMNAFKKAATSSDAPSEKLTRALQIESESSS